MGKTEERIAALGLTLPPMPKPLASYVPIVQSGNMVFLSGHIPFKEDMKSLFVGKVGVASGYSTEEASEFAKTIALELISTLKGEGLRACSFTCWLGKKCHLACLTPRPRLLAQAT